MQDRIMQDSHLRPGSLHNSANLSGPDIGFARPPDEDETKKRADVGVRAFTLEQCVCYVLSQGPTRRKKRLSG